jgi:hypothetical protein
VELCLDVQQHLAQQACLCGGAKGSHDVESTRAQEPEQAECLQSRGLMQQHDASPQPSVAELLERQAKMELEQRQLRQEALAINALQEEQLRFKALLMRSPAAAATPEAER